MGFWSKLFNKRAVDLPSGYELKDGMVIASSGSRGPARRGTADLINSYNESPWLRAAVSRIARGVASVSWCAYARAQSSTRTPSHHRWRQSNAGRFRDVSVPPAWDWTCDKGIADHVLKRGTSSQRAARRVELAGNGLLRELSDHPILRLLDAPNELITGRTMMHSTQIWLDLKGEAFWIVGRTKEGTPSTLWPVPPHWVTSVPTKEKPVFDVNFSGLAMHVKASDMIWFKDPNPLNPYGRGSGVAESLSDEIETDDYAAKYLKAWFHNSAMPSFLVSFEGATFPEVQRAKEKWESEHRGFFNSHRAHFSTGKMNAVRLDASFRDQQIPELRRLSRDTTGQVFAVPPELLGIIENSNRSTIDAARYIYSLGVEFPRAELLRSEIQAQLCPMFDDALALEVEVPVPVDEQRKLDTMRAMPGAFALNEWREEAGLEPLAELEGKFPPLAMPGQMSEAKLEEADDKAETELEPTSDAERDPPWTRELAAVAEY